jgi:predicted ArsR family transcriptional regulator
MRWWETSVGGATRGRIIGFLRRGERSVDELATELGVTDNAVRAQLEALEREGVVHQARVRHTGAVGKPATMYAIRPEVESSFSTAYAPVLGALVAALGERMSPAQLEQLFREVGQRLAEDAKNNQAQQPKALDARVRAAAAILTSLGAELEIERSGAGFVLRGHACPLSNAVRAEPRVCSAIEELVAGVTGAPVRECCERDAATGATRCRFEVQRGA